MACSLIFKKPKEWSSRYLIPELAAIFSALLGTNLTYLLFPSATLIVVSFVTTWAENIGYYSIITYRDIVEARRNAPETPLRTLFLKVGRDLLIEFGAAECIDSFLLRPACMYLSFTLVKNHSLATLLGKLIADIGFYVVAVIGYEARKKLFK